MKQLFPLLGLLVSTASVASAQKSQPSQFGLKVGASFTSFVGADVADASTYKTGFHAGLVICSPINRHFALQPEILYSQKGIHVAADAVTGVPDGNVTLHYFEVPVLVRFPANELSIEAGPQFGILLAAQYVYRDPSGTVVSQSTTALYNAPDLGYVLGVGFHAKGGLLLGIRYNGGFTNVARAIQARNAAIQLEGRNSAFQFYAGFVFGRRDGHAREFSQ